MPQSFEYVPFNGAPYAASVAELLAHQHDATARAAIATGDAAARAQEIRGQVWGKALEQAGQIPGQVLQQQRQDQERAQLGKLRQTEIDKNTQALMLQKQATDRAAAGQQYIATELPKFQTADPVTGKKTTDYQAFSDAMAAHGFPDAAENFSKLAATSADALTKWHADELTQAKNRASRLGELADTSPDAGTFLASVGLAHSEGLLDDPTAQRIAAQVQQAGPDGWTGLKANLLKMAPEIEEHKITQEKLKAETVKSAAEAAKATAEAENLRKFGRTTPGTPEEQYLHALSTGDQPTAARVLQSIHDTANARKDPAAQALAQQLSGLRADEARARLEGLQQKNAPADIEPDIQTTVAGRKYLDLSGYTGEARTKARAAAGAAGVIGVSKEQANALQEIDNARMNQRSIVAQIGDLLPKGPAGRPVAAIAVPLQKLFQTNDQVAAFNSWRTAAIQTLRATAGSKGLRINQAEIAQAIENDIPKLTDTLGTAQQKVKNIETMLENAEQSILVRDRSVVPPAAAPKTSGLTPGLAGLAAR